MKKLLDNSNYCIEIAEPLNEDNIANSIKEALLINYNAPELHQPYGNNIENISWDAYGKRYYEIIQHII